MARTHSLPPSTLPGPTARVVFSSRTTGSTGPFPRSWTQRTTSSPPAQIVRHPAPKGVSPRAVKLGVSVRRPSLLAFCAFPTSAGGRGLGVGAPTWTPFPLRLQRETPRKNPGRTCGGTRSVDFSLRRRLNSQGPPVQQRRRDPGVGFPRASGRSRKGPTLVGKRSPPDVVGTHCGPRSTLILYSNDPEPPTGVLPIHPPLPATPTSEPSP